MLFLAIAVGVFFLVKWQYARLCGTSDDVGPIAINNAGPPESAPEGMVWVPGGMFWMGSEKFDDAQPIHKVYVDGFWMDRTEVTNEQFARFVAESNYITVVEQWPILNSLRDFDATPFTVFNRNTLPTSPWRLGLPAFTGFFLDRHEQSAPDAQAVLVRIHRSKTSRRSLQGRHWHMAATGRLGELEASRGAGQQSPGT